MRAHELRIHRQMVRYHLHTREQLVSTGSILGKTARKCRIHTIVSQLFANSSVNTALQSKALNT